ncbi:UNVERIFIED_CONTAM: hypothetical protein GTU68_041674 [Idotea baltica]|nr:hypothetical protein [Idotea baltica]
MGIVNITPDSFYSESRSLDPHLVLEKVVYMVDNQVDIVDLGAMSSRPGAEIISPEEELKRILPSFKLIRMKFPSLFISIDTLHAQVAEACLSHGADMINDISAFSVDKNLISVVSKQNIPENMQQKPEYDDVSLDVLSFLKNKVNQLRNAGINDIIIDPGFGFGKSIDDNYQILNDLEVFKILELPILVGLSRKSMIYRPLGVKAEESLAATTALHLLALQKGANILRVHDVKEAQQAVNLFNLLNI